MFAWIHEAFAYIGINSGNEKLMIAGLLGVCFVAFALRVILSFGYSSKSAMVSLSARNIAVKDDIGKLKMGAFARMAKDYATLGEKGVAGIDARSIVEKDMLRFRFIFWNYRSMEKFVLGLENGLLFLGLIFCLVGESKEVLAIAGVSAFLVSRLFAALFDFGVSREKYLENSIFILNREIGRFYVLDMSSAIRSLSNEIKISLAAQAKTTNDGLAKISSDLADAVKTSMNTMTRSVESTMNSISAYGGALREPIENWKAAVETAGGLQNRINAASDSLNTAMTGFASVIGAMGNTFSDYKHEINAAAAKTGEEIEKLREIGASLERAASNLSQRNMVFEEGLNNVAHNQSLLEKTVQQYEASLKELTSQLGDAMGKILEYHIQGASTALSEGVASNLDKISHINEDLIQRIQALFEQAQAQSKIEMGAVISMKEQMDLHFESLKTEISRKE